VPGPQWLPLIARVVWRSEGKHASRPVMLEVGGRRIEVTLERRWTEGPQEAGDPLWRVFLLRDENGRHLRVRIDEMGRERVEIDQNERRK
jgi:hypothetical protein